MEMEPPASYAANGLLPTAIRRAAVPRATRSISKLLLLVLLAALLPGLRPALAASFSVTTTADSGAGSLRAAIDATNASAGPDTITFAIPAGSVISLSSPLPPLTDNGTTIEGPTTAGGQPGVEIRGSQIVVGGGTAGGPGLYLQSAGNTIRNLIINGFRETFADDKIGGSGITITGSNNKIENCYIGTNAAGTSVGSGSEPNQNNHPNAGVFLTNGASNNTIDNNVISGNGGFGIYLTSSYLGGQFQTGNIISNNRIGVTATGAARLRNSHTGIYVGDNSNDNVIGPGNVVSGNGPATGVPDPDFPIDFNIVVSGNAGGQPGVISGNLVRGNKIGTDAAGNATIQNTVDGLFVSAAANTVVGGTNPPDSADPDRGNIISGNIIGLLAHDRSNIDQALINLTVTNNWIGLNGAGTVAAGNLTRGISIEQAARSVFVGPGNVVSGNGTDGIALRSNKDAAPSNQTRANTILGNLIGTNAAGTAQIPNQGAGVLIEGPTYDNSVGPDNRVLGHAAGGVVIKNSSYGAPYQNTVRSNVLRQNAIGISVSGTGADNNLIEANRVEASTSDGVQIIDGAAKNRITRTTTTANGGAGIALSNGGNGGILPPTITGLTVSGTSPNQTLSGVIDTRGANCGGSGCTVEIFQSSAAENYEGPLYLTSVTVAGSSPFNVPIAGCEAFLTFTITDQNNNTSEFSAASSRVSNCNGAVTPSAPAAELTPETQTQNGTPGLTITFQHTLTNVGGEGTFDLAVTGLPAAWNANVAPSTVTLAASGQTAVQVSATVPAGTEGGDYTLTVTATPRGGGTADSATDTIRVPLTPGLTFTPPTQTKQAGPGQRVCYDHTLTNTGNGSDTFSITASPPNGWTAEVTPNTVTLAQGASQTVMVCVTVPQGAAVQQGTTQVTATSNSAPNPSVTVSDITDVLAAAVPRLSLGQQASTDPGRPVSFTHTVTNVGNVDGSFNLVAQVPASWSVSSLQPVTLNQNESASFTLIITPSNDALAGTYPVIVRAENSQNTSIFDSVTDQVTISQVAGIALSDDQASDEPPNSVATYTLTLTNSGNFTDTVSLTASAALTGWSAQPVTPTVIMPPQSSRPIQLQVTIPPGQDAGLQNTSILTATSSTGITDTAQVTTTVEPAAGVLLLPQPGITKAAVAGAAVPFTFTLLNSGSVVQTASVTVTGVPFGWSAMLTPTGALTLKPGMTTTVELVLQSPPDIPNGAISVTLEAGAETALGLATSSAFAQVVIGPPYGLEIAPDRSGSRLPGLPIRYTHYVTNTGRVSDTIAIDTVSKLGWETFAAPPSLRLEPGATGIVTVTVVVPRTASAGTIDTTTVTARSTAAPEVTASVVDTTTVEQFAGVSFSPSRSAVLAPGREIRFQHTVVNLGNGPDAFMIKTSQELDWEVTVVPTTTLTIPRGGNYPVDVTVKVPANVQPSAINRISLRAVSRFDSAAADAVQDTVSMPPEQNTMIYRTYMPLTQRTATK